MVAVFVADHAEDFPDDHILDPRAGAGKGLHLAAGEGHGVAKRLVIHIRGVNKLGKPFSAEIHALSPSPFLKLLQKTDVIFKDQAQVADFVIGQGQTLQAEAEGPSGVDFRVDAAAGEHLGVDHARA